ncbi:hypothetical protein RhiTH_004043 [Rhizoctonia solani]
MDIEICRDEIRLPWSPFGGTLASIRGGATDQSYLHNVTLKVINASSGAELTVTQAWVNGSLNADRWIVLSDDTRLSYTGFTQHAGAAKAGSSTTYVSSKAGDKASMRFNASTFLIHGPWGPTNGQIKVSIDGRESTVKHLEAYRIQRLPTIPGLGISCLKRTRFTY